MKMSENDFNSSAFVNACEILLLDGENIETVRRNYPDSMMEEYGQRTGLPKDKVVGDQLERRAVRDLLIQFNNMIKHGELALGKDRHCAYFDNPEDNFLEIFLTHPKAAEIIEEAKQRLGKDWVLDKDLKEAGLAMGKPVAVKRKAAEPVIDGFRLVEMMAAAKYFGASEDTQEHLRETLRELRDAYLPPKGSTRDDFLDRERGLNGVRLMLTTQSPEEIHYIFDNSRSNSVARDIISKKALAKLLVIFNRSLQDKSHVREDIKTEDRHTYEQYVQALASHPHVEQILAAAERKMSEKKLNWQVPEMRDDIRAAIPEREAKKGFDARTLADAADYLELDAALVNRLRDLQGGNMDRAAPIATRTTLRDLLIELNNKTEAGQVAFGKGLDDAPEQFIDALLTHPEAFEIMADAKKRTGRHWVLSTQIERMDHPALATQGSARG